ncbi:TIGR02391 family protein [Kitasatospora sp. NPDC057936]|uniref:TIGR02391 family protein n=1 Tax=Kitasatospora sp. NPDC057936 TaxID=3346283 RepID=UPI0036DAB1D1
MRITAPEGMPRPAGGDGYELLEALFWHMSDSGEWPTFDTLDRTLNRKGIEYEVAVQQLPDDLVWGIDTRRGALPQSHQQIQLTPAGLANCESGGPVIRAMLLLLEQAVGVENGWEPALDPKRGVRPSIDFNAFVAGRDPNTIDADVIVFAAKVSVTEPWCVNLSFGEGPESWAISFDRQVRKFAGIGVNDLRGYWKRRQQVLGRTETSTATETASSSLVMPEPAPMAGQGDEELSLTCLLHPAITAVSARRFETGHYADAVFAAFKAVEYRVQLLMGSTEIGEKLMGIALGTNAPRLVVTRSTGASLPSEQSGMRDLFKGAMQALRNPRGHGADESDDREEAQETLMLASWLMRRLDIAEAVQTAANPVVP